MEKLLKEARDFANSEYPCTFAIRHEEGDEYITISTRLLRFEPYCFRDLDTIKKFMKSYEGVESIHKRALDELADFKRKYERERY